MAEEEERQMRYHEYVENVSKKNSNLTTSNMSDHSCGPSSEVNNIANQWQDKGKSNQTLPIKKFYGVNICPQSSANSVSASSNTSVFKLPEISYAPSNASVFKLPQTTKEFSGWYKHETAFNAFMKLIKACCNKITIRLFMKFLQEFTQVTDFDDTPYDPIYFLENCVNQVKNKYYAGNKAPSVSSVSSRMVDQASTTGSQYVPFLRSELSVDQGCRSISQSYRPINRGRQQESTMFRRQEQDMLLPHEESSVGLSLFNDTEQAQQRDELAALQNPDDTVMEKRPAKRATASSARPGSNKDLENKSIINRNDTLFLNKMGAKAVSRTGRLIKSPVQFWKGNESRINDTINEKKLVSRKKQDKVDLNESMTLRSNKVLQPTPVKVLPKKRGRSNASIKPLTTISENKNDNDSKTFKNPLPPKNNKLSKKQDKENSTLHVTKNNTKQVSKTNNKKIATMKQVESKAEKPQKAAKKRKSKNANDSACKRKKIEEDLHSETLENQFSEDELFGSVGFKKRPAVALQALSPSKVQLLSVKKQLAASSSKETPPCKALGQMIDVSGFSSTSHSTVKELPDTKATRVVKRMTKVTENKVADKTKKKEARGSKTALGSYTTTTPLSQNAVFTMFSSIVDHDSDAWSEGSSANSDDNDDDLV